MAVTLARSPQTFIYPQLTTAKSLKLIINIDGGDRYTITKNFVNGWVAIEYAELVRDYIEIKYNSVSTWSAKVITNYITYDGLNATGSVLEDVTSTGNFWSDGYGYFEEGTSPAANGLMQTNTTIYKLGDAEIRIPIDRNSVDRVTYIYQGDVVSTEAITTSTTQAFQYVGENIISFQERVEDDGGTYESTFCIREFLDEFEINAVDEIIVTQTNGQVKRIKVITVEECKYEPLQLSFVNKFGAIQDVWFFKKSIKSLKTKSEDFNRVDLSFTGSYNTLDHTKKVFNVTSNKSIKLNTGYVDESYNSIMQELMQSEYVWIKQDNEVLPVNVDKNSLTFKTSVNDKLVDYSIDLDYSFNAINNIR